MKIIVADDDPVSRTLMSAILQSGMAGYQVLAAEDGTAAWAMLQANPDASLAILDVSMPGLTGLQLVDRIRGDARLAAMPVIICTASADRATVTAAASRGVRHFLAKPFARTTVLDKVLQICRPAAVESAVLDNSAAIREQLEIDRGTHNELIEQLLRMGEAWTSAAQRATDFNRVRALAILAGSLHPLFSKAGGVSVAAAFKDAEQTLGVFRHRPLRNEEPEVLRQGRLVGEKVQRELDRLRAALHTTT